MLESRPFGMEEIYTSVADNSGDTSALTRQVGGEHYKSAYQPIQLMEKVKMYGCCSFILKYVYRYKKKNGIDDLKKSLHCCELLENLGYNWYQGTGDIYSYDNSFIEFHKFIKLNPQLDSNQIRAILAICDKDIKTLKSVIIDSIKKIS